jgi:hypothetical protein
MAVVPLALLAAGCGDDEPAATSTSTTATTPDDTADDGGSTGDPAVASAWARTASEFRDRVGETVDVECPPDGVLGSLWGTNTYTDDSSICTAAVHAGLITVEDGGEVTIEILEGQDEYLAAESNGVESKVFGPFEGSFSFPDAEPIEVAATIGWDRAANFYAGREVTEFTVECEAGGQPGSVWGTDVYTDDSSICTAAVHAGVITADEGGEVTFEITGGEQSYEGTEANGISSQDFGPYDGSFRFVEG